MLTLFIPVIKEETKRLGILLQSLNYFMDPRDIEILILTPASHLKYVSGAVDKMSKPQTRINYLTDEEIHPYDRESTAGWERQQALKLLVSDRIKTEFYLVFDCDVFATKPFSISDLVKDGKGIMDLQSEPSDFQDVKVIADILKMELKDTKTEVMKVTPALLSTNIVGDLLRYLSNEKCDGNKEDLPTYLYNLFKSGYDENNSERITEYMLYYFYTLHTKTLWDKHFKGLLVDKNNVWYPEECFQWDPAKSFSGEGLFCVYQGNFNIPSSIVFDQVRDYMGAPRDTHVPKVSCLMVTKDRLDLVKTATVCFQNQTYPNKELVIVCDSKDGVAEYIGKLQDPNIVLFQLPPKARTLGDLRNFSIDRSTGDLITQWDDDDWYHPSRLSIQYNHLKSSNSDACLLGQWLMAWPDTGRYGISNVREDGWEGTMLAKKSVVPRYQNLRKFEDTEMMERLFKTSKVHVITDPDYYFLYIYLVHGNNTWDSDHFKVMFDDSTPLDTVWKESYKKTSSKLSELVGMEYEGYTYMPTKDIMQQNKYVSLAFLLIMFACIWWFLLR